MPPERLSRLDARLKPVVTAVNTTLGPEFTPVIPQSVEPSLLFWKRDPQQGQYYLVFSLEKAKHQKGPLSYYAGLAVDLGGRTPPPHPGSLDTYLRSEYWPEVFGVPLHEPLAIPHTTQEDVVSLADDAKTILQRISTKEKFLKEIRRLKRVDPGALNILLTERAKERLGIERA